MQAVLVFLPVDPPVWAQKFTRWALARSVAYFPTTLHVEEELRLGRPYVVGAHRACSTRAEAHTRSSKFQAQARKRTSEVDIAACVLAVSTCGRSVPLLCPVKASPVLASHQIAFW